MKYKNHAQPAKKEEGQYLIFQKKKGYGVEVMLPKGKPVKTGSKKEWG